MANVGQATFIGPDLIILCDSKWSCCQREQAKAKVQEYNRQLPKNIRKSVSTRLKKAKKKCCTGAWDDWRDKCAAGDRAEEAPNRAISKCLADELKKSPSKQRGTDDLEMDHGLDTKLGGKAWQDLKLLDGTVNGFFGGTVAKALGDKMRAGGEKKVESASLVCPKDPPCKPPHTAGKGKSYSTGKRRAYPKKSTLTKSTVSPEHVLK